MQFEVYNPNNKPVSELPVIYGFNNGGTYGFMYGEILAEDGTHLGSHICTHESFMKEDLGVIKGSRRDRHEKTFQKHYPDGYRMEFVSRDDVESNEGLMKALELNALQPDMEEDEE